jgi:hypothetical protein
MKHSRHHCDAESQPLPDIKARTSFPSLSVAACHSTRTFPQQTELRVLIPDITHMHASLLFLSSVLLLNWGTSLAAPIRPGDPGSRAATWGLQYDAVNNHRTPSNADQMPRPLRAPMARYILGRQLYNADYSSGGSPGPSVNGTDDSTTPDTSTPSAAPPASSPAPPPPPSSAPPQARSVTTPGHIRRRFVTRPKSGVFSRARRVAEGFGYARKGENGRSWGWSRDLIPATAHGGVDGDTAITNGEIQKDTAMMQSMRRLVMPYRKADSDVADSEGM